MVAWTYQKLANSRSRRDGDLNIKTLEQLKNTPEVRLDLPPQTSCTGYLDVSPSRGRAPPHFAPVALAERLEDGCQVIRFERMVQMGRYSGWIVPKLFGIVGVHCPLIRSFGSDCGFGVTAFPSNAGILASQFEPNHWGLR